MHRNNVHLNPELIWKPAALDIAVQVMYKFISYGSKRTYHTVNVSLRWSKLWYSSYHMFV